MLGRHALPEKLLGLDGNIRSPAAPLADETAQIGQLGPRRSAHHLVVMCNACLEHLRYAEPGCFAQEVFRMTTYVNVCLVAESRS